MPELIVVRADECHPLREAVLRPGQPAEAWTYGTDDQPRAIHFALKEKGEVLGVASLLPEAREDGGRELWRLRGMAVLEARRGEGHGRTLLAAVQAVAKQRGGGLWCTARTSVEAFYRKYDFVTEGEAFEIEGAGPHVLMTWNPSRGRGVPADRREEHARLAEDAGSGDEIDAMDDGEADVGDEAIGDAGASPALHDEGGRTVEG
jgi:predicted GNAT family N-acyltransferase